MTSQNCVFQLLFYVEFELYLRQFNPDAIISMSPSVAMIRTLEVYYAERFYKFETSRSFNAPGSFVKVELNAEHSRDKTNSPVFPTSAETLTEAAAASTSFVGSNVQVGAPKFYGKAIIFIYYGSNATPSEAGFIVPFPNCISQYLH